MFSGIPNEKFFFQRQKYYVQCVRGWEQKKILSIQSLFNQETTSFHLVVFDSIQLSDKTLKFLK